jgi:hypothetical protein
MQVKAHDSHLLVIAIDDLSPLPSSESIASWVQAGFFFVGDLLPKSDIIFFSGDKLTLF